MTDSLMFSHMVELDKVVSGALGVREQSKVDMKQILDKVTVLVKRNVAQHNILKKLRHILGYVCHGVINFHFLSSQMLNVFHKCLHNRV